MTQYNYPMGHHSHSFVGKNSRKGLKTGLSRYSPLKPLILHKDMFYGLMSGVQLSYGITQISYCVH
jgi:hypothetical protein